MTILKFQRQLYDETTLALVTHCWMNMSTDRESRKPALLPQSASRCGYWYRNKLCQKADWKRHKIHCKRGTDDVDHVPIITTLSGRYFRCLSALCGSHLTLPPNLRILCYIRELSYSISSSATSYPKESSVHKTYGREILAQAIVTFQQTGQHGA